MSDTPQAPDTVQPTVTEPEVPATEAAPEAPPEQPTPEASPPPDTAAEGDPNPERVVPAADGYKLPEGIPPQVGEFAHKIGLTQEQLDANLEFFGEVVKSDRAMQMQNLRKLGEAHLKSWGSEADYKLSLAKRALKQNDPTGTLTKALNETGYGNHPAVLDFLSNLGATMQEGGFLKSAVNKPPGQKTAAQAMFGANHPSKS